MLENHRMTLTLIPWLRPLLFSQLCFEDMLEIWLRALLKTHTEKAFKQVVRLDPALH